MRKETLNNPGDSKYVVSDRSSLVLKGLFHPTCSDQSGDRDIHSTRVTQNACFSYESVHDCVFCNFFFFQEKRTDLGSAWRIMAARGQTQIYLRNHDDCIND